MNPIIRNFWSIFRCYRLAMTLNVLGMAVAFAAFMVIMMQWRYDVTFDDATPHSERIFRVESDIKGLDRRPSRAVRTPNCSSNHRRTSSLVV